MDTLGARIRHLRMLKGLTQKQLAMGICTSSLVSQCECDKSGASYRLLSAFAERLEVSLEQLLEDVVLDIQSQGKATMVKAMVEAGEYHLALPLLEQLLHSENTVMGNDDLTYRLGMCYVHTSKTDKAISLLNSLIESSLAGNDKQMPILAMLGLGSAFEMQKRYQLAIYHTEQALITYEKFDEYNPGLHQKILLQLAKLNQAIGHMGQASKHYEQTAKLYDRIFDTVRSAQINLILAQSYQTKDDLEKSRSYTALAMAQFRKAGDMDAYNDTRIRSLLLSHNESNWQRIVRQLIASAVDYEEQENKRERAGKLFARISAICVEYGDMERAEMAAEDALSILSGDVPVSERGIALRSLAIVCFAGGDDETGILHLTNSIAIFKQMDNLTEAEKATQLLVQHLTALGKHEVAIGHLEDQQRYVLSKLTERGIVL